MSKYVHRVMQKTTQGSASAPIICVGDRDKGTEWEQYQYCYLCINLIQYLCNTTTSRLENEQAAKYFKFHAQKNFTNYLSRALI